MTAAAKSGILWKKLSMSQKFVLLVTLFLFFLSAYFVFWKNQTTRDPDEGKSWWIAAFSDVEASNSLSFIIENHTPTTDFSYRITHGDSLIYEERLVIPSGSLKAIDIPSLDTPARENRITITHADETRTLYR